MSQFDFLLFTGLRKYIAKLESVKQAAPMSYNYFAINEAYPVVKSQVANLFQPLAQVNMMAERFQDDEIGASFQYNRALRLRMPVSRYYQCNCFPPGLAAAAQQRGCSYTQ